MGPNGENNLYISEDLKTYINGGARFYTFLLYANFDK